MEKFAWINVDKAKIILLNDFSWQKEQIAWKDFLLLLEGHTVRLPTPKKTQYAKDRVLSRAQMMLPSLLLAKDPFFKGTYNYTDSEEDRTMATR